MQGLKIGPISLALQGVTIVVALYAELKRQLVIPCIDAVSISFRWK